MSEPQVIVYPVNTAVKSVILFVLIPGRLLLDPLFSDMTYQRKGRVRGLSSRKLTDQEILDALNGDDLSETIEGVEEAEKETEDPRVMGPSKETDAGVGGHGGGGGDDGGLSGEGQGGVGQGKGCHGVGGGLEERGICVRGGAAAGVETRPGDVQHTGGQEGRGLGCPVSPQRVPLQPRDLLGMRPGPSHPTNITGTDEKDNRSVSPVRKDCAGEGGREGPSKEEEEPQMKEPNETFTIGEGANFSTSWSDPTIRVPDQVPPERSGNFPKSYVESGHMGDWFQEKFGANSEEPAAAVRDNSEAGLESPVESTPVEIIDNEDTLVERIGVETEIEDMNVDEVISVVVEEAGEDEKVQEISEEEVEELTSKNYIKDDAVEDIDVGDEEESSDPASDEGAVGGQVEEETLAARLGPRINVDLLADQVSLSSLNFSVSSPFLPLLSSIHVRTDSGRMI